MSLRLVIGRGWNGVWVAQLSVLRLSYLPVFVFLVFAHAVNKAGEGVLVYCSSIVIDAVQELVSPVGIVFYLILRNKITGFKVFLELHQFCTVNIHFPLPFWCSNILYK